MERGSGGRFLFRLVGREDGQVTYDGSFEVEGNHAACRARVLLPAGAVELSHDAGAVPPWLLDQARAALRAAFRASLAGTPWPRRIHRFKESRSKGEDE